jgi:hypothetical protein
MKFLNQELLKSKLQAIRSEAMSRKRILIVVALAVGLILAVTAFYRQKSAGTNTYYVAYVGRYADPIPTFDRLHELALRKYLDKLNAELSGIRFELKPFKVNNVNGSFAIYQEIQRDNRIVLVIDNSWGKDFQSVVSIVHDDKIPVININADKSVADFGNNAVFLGNDDGVPEKVTNFCTRILEHGKAIFITENNYALTDVYHKQFKNHGPVITSEIPLSSYQPNENDRVNLYRDLDAKINELQSQAKDKKALVILNTHQYWGNEIIGYIEDHYQNVLIIGGPYIINGTKYNSAHGPFDQSNKGNSLIMINFPNDAVSQKIYNDFNELKRTKGEDPMVFNDIKASLYVKRCLDAISLMRGALLDKDNNPKSAVSRNAFTDFFHNELVGKKFVGNEGELYIFDNDLMLRDERPFELHTRGKTISFSKQLNQEGIPISNIYFGIEIINVSNIDVGRKSFHADFFYWVKSDSANPDVDKYIQFRNERRQNSERDIPLYTEPESPFPNEGRPNLERDIPPKAKPDSPVYKLFKKSADFSMDVDFNKYPFDSQELRIEVEIIKPKDKIISFDNADFEDSKAKMKKANLDEWTIKDFYITVDNYITTSLHGDVFSENQTPQKFKTLNVRMPISRNSAVPIVTIILPLLMIGITAISILFVKDNSFANVGEVCVVIFLSVVTYSVGFAQLTPRSNVLTIADILFYGTFLLVLLIFLRIIFFSSSLISDSVRAWSNKRAVSIGLGASIGYLMLIVAIIIYAKS